MEHRMRSKPALTLPALLLAGVTAAQACGACGCTLNSDWASQGFATTTGFRFDLRYDTFNQDQLRTGTIAADRSAFGLPNDQEIQQYTRNRNLTLTLDYSPTPDWGATLVLPTYDRSHATLAEGDTDPTFSRAEGLGDARVMGRYQGFSSEHSFGVQFGLKLPTGGTTQTFYAGAEAGQPVDAGLQLGAGTTDLLLGAYGFGRLATNWGCFGQVLFQHATGENNGFKPGDGLNANLGLRYTGFTAVTPQLQVNGRIEGRESGLNADGDNSGASLLYLSPGLTFNVSRTFRVYAFAQVPLLQRVNGLQLEPRSSLSLGLHWSF